MNYNIFGLGAKKTLRFMTFFSWGTNSALQFTRCGSWGRKNTMIYNILNWRQKNTIHRIFELGTNKNITMCRICAIGKRNSEKAICFNSIFELGTKNTSIYIIFSRGQKI